MAEFLAEDGHCCTHPCFYGTERKFEMIGKFGLRKAAEVRELDEIFLVFGK